MINWEVSVKESWAVFVRDQKVIHTDITSWNVSLRLHLALQHVFFRAIRTRSADLPWFWYEVLWPGLLSPFCWQFYGLLINLTNVTQTKRKTWKISWTKMLGSSTSKDCNWFQDRLRIVVALPSCLSFLLGGERSLSELSLEPFWTSQLLEDEALNRWRAMVRNCSHEIFDN